MRYQDLLRYLETRSEKRFQPIGPMQIPPRETWEGILRPGLAVYAEDVQEYLETLGPTTFLRAVWIAVEKVFDLYEEGYQTNYPDRDAEVLSWIAAARPILDWFRDLPLKERSGIHLYRQWEEFFTQILQPINEAIDPRSEPGPWTLFSALTELSVLLTQLHSELFTRFQVGSSAVVNAAMAYSHLVVPLRAPHEFDQRPVREFIEWWWQAVRRRIAERRARTDGPKLAAVHSESRSMRQYYEDAFKKWKDRKGFVLWDSVKGVFDSVFNTSDFRQLTNSLGLPVTHIPGIGKALKAVGSFVLSSLWVAPKIAKSVGEQTGLEPEKVEKLFGAAKFIDSVTPGPWGSGIIILYFTLATAGKAPSKAAMKGVIAAKAKVIEKLQAALERERMPKMKAVKGPSSSGKNPLRKITSEFKDVAEDEKDLKKEADKVGDFAFEIGEWSSEFEDFDEALDAALLAVMPAHERLISQGDDYESENLLDMALYLAGEALQDLAVPEEQFRLAAGPRFRD